MAYPLCDAFLSMFPLHTGYQLHSVCVIQGEREEEPLPLLSRDASRLSSCQAARLASNEGSRDDPDGPRIVEAVRFVAKITAQTTTTTTTSFLSFFLHYTNNRKQTVRQNTMG